MTGPRARRALGLVVLAATVVAACGDDGTAADPVTTTSTPVEPGPPAGPTTSTTEPADCLLLADEYLSAAAELFGGPPDDQAVEAGRARFAELDTLAAAGGCGDGYREAVCDGLDELTRSGTLVIYPMTTARCI